MQVVGIPVAEQYGDYLDGVIDQLRAKGVRAEVDHSDDRMPKKIRTHEGEGSVPTDCWRRGSRSCAAL